MPLQYESMRIYDPVNRSKCWKIKFLQPNVIKFISKLENNDWIAFKLLIIKATKIIIVLVFFIAKHQVKSIVHKNK